MWIVIDEASRFLSNALRFRADLGPPILQDQAQSMRKRSLFLMAGAQSPAEIPVAAMANFSTRIIFRTVDGTNIRYLAEQLALMPEQRAYLPALPNRRALLSYPFWPRAFVIEIPELDWPKIGARQVQEAMEPVLSSLSWVPVDAVPEPPARPSANPEANGTQADNGARGSMLSHGETGYLIAIARDPFVPATERDRKNKVALGTGAAMRKKLAEGGYLIVHKMKPPWRSGEITLTEISDRGWEELRLRKAGVRKPAGRGSWKHTYWQATIRSWIETHHENSNPRIEAMVNGKAIDILANIDGEAEALEVVCNGDEWASRIKEVKNIIKDIEVAGVGKVNVCAEDQQVLTRIREHVQRELGNEYIDKHQGKVQWRLLAEFLK